ncbi:MAG: hypothetical protein LBT09_15325 [Planctomycetaceae bacterium]|jgi:hypothetical protein|nr:hypothetical protein [Planctomycetaceae bacterium]
MYILNAKIIFIVMLMYCFFVIITDHQRIISCKEHVTDKLQSTKELECINFLTKESSEYSDKMLPLANINVLNFSNNCNITGSEFGILSETPNVKELKFLCAKNLTDAFSKSLMHTQLLKILNLTETSVTEHSIDDIAQLKNLEVLRISHAINFKNSKPTFNVAITFSDQTLIKLKACTKLRQLYIGEQCTITDQGLQNLKEYKNLEYFGLVSPNITADGIEFLKTLMWIKRIDVLLPVQHRKPTDGKIMMSEIIKVGDMLILYQHIEKLP